MTSLLNNVKPKKMTRSLAMVAASLALSFSLVGCSEKNEPVKAVEPIQQIEAKVERVELGSIPLLSVVPGAVVPDQKAQISSRLMGYIKKMNVEVGQKIKRGDALFEIDSNDVNSGVTQAKSAYAQAKAGLADAKLDYDRFKKLYADASVSKQQFDKMNLKYKIAQENLLSARSSLSQARSQLSYANVTAPFDGVIVEKNAVAGDLAAPGKPILTIENQASLSVQAHVAKELFAVLRPGDLVEVILDGQPKPVMATLYTLVGASDPKTRTHVVKLSLPAIKNINSGTFARINFQRGVRQTMMVPNSAIVNRSGIKGVFIVEDNTAYFHMVRLGETVGERVEIQSGVSLGDAIVVTNNMSMLNGDQVNILP